MHHEEGIQHLTLGQLKPQLGLIKQERKVPHFPGGNWQMEEVYCSNTPNSSACYFFFFTAFYQPQFDLTPVLPIAALVQYQDLESNQPRRDTQMCSFTAQFLLTQLPHGDIYNTLLLCYFQCHYYITFERVTRLYTREITLKL